MSTLVSVAVFEMEASTPPIKTKFPAGISSAGMKYLEYCLKKYNIKA